MSMNLPGRPHPAFSQSHEPARGMLLPPALLPVAIALFLVGGTGPNVLLALLSIAVLVVGSVLLWRPGESPILLFAFAYPWMQGSVAIFHANWLGIDLANYSTIPGEIRNAAALSLLGVLTLAVGMRLGAGRRRHVAELMAMRQQALAHAMQRWFQLYAWGWGASFIALSSAWIVPGLSQPMLALASLRWAFFFLLAYAYFVRVRDRGRTFPLVFLYELGASIGGYFSDFKTVFFFTFLAVLASGVRIALSTQLAAAALTTFAGALGVVWTAVKGEYRAFISGGQAAQAVSADYVSRITKLFDLITGLDAETLTRAADQLLRRISYVEFFGAVLTYVPASIPHTLGAILWDAITRPFLPRILFPNKDVIDDTARTNLFTGGLAGHSEGTSISLGYVAEAYIDFGEIGMFAALLAIGIFYGTIYRALIRWRRTRGLLGMALASAVLIGVGPLESSFTKIFGGVAVSLLAVWLTAIFIVPRFAPWLGAGWRR
ncbi:MAG TPA: hypothetical protein VFZ16_16250 [Hyphomicrobiaceae bacterium]|nr:hypothetical protein [Hyphomicrobiaceae bacterium]